MRNLVEYPVTSQEIIDCLLDLAKRREDDPVILGDMTGILLRTAADIVKSTQVVPGDPNTVLKLWTIYDHPLEYPGFMARLFIVHKGGMGPRDVAFYGPTLESVRAQLPDGLYNMGRQPEDEPQIIETWI